MCSPLLQSSGLPSNSAFEGQIWGTQPKNQYELMAKQEMFTLNFQSCWVLVRLKTSHFQSLRIFKKTKASQDITESQ